MFPSESLINAGIYPNKGFLPDNAQEPWNNFRAGITDPCEAGGIVENWFRIFDREDLDDVYVHEEYISIPSMGTLLVLLTLDESDVFENDDEDDSDEDD